MITLAYDETAGFEVETVEPAFIAGIIYDSKNDKEYNGVECERARIENFFRAVCADAGVDCRFPRDLHRMPMNGISGSDNCRLESAVKRKLNQALPEFFTKGTFKGKELLFLDSEGNLVAEAANSVKQVSRKGRYQLIVIQKGDDINIPEDIQVYREMVRRIIQNGIYTNSAIDKNQIVHINAPTRVIKDDEIPEGIRNGFKRQGYRYENSQRLWFVLESGDIRGIKDQCDSSIRFINPDLFIKRLKDGYALGTNDSSGAQAYSFLFLADALCSYIKNNIFGCVQQKSLMEIMTTLQDFIANTNSLQEPDKTIIERIIGIIRSAQRDGIWVEQLNGSNRLRSEEARKLLRSIKDKYNFHKENISALEYADALTNALKPLNAASGSRVYVFDKYSIALDSVIYSVMDKDYFGAFSKLYDFDQINEVGIEKKVWRRYQREIEADLRRNVNRSVLFRAIKNLDEYRLLKKEEMVFEPDRLNYIFERIFNLSAMLEQAAVLNTDQKAKLYDIGISAATHVGDTKRAFVYYTEYMKVRGVETSLDGFPVQMRELSEETLLVVNRSLTGYHDFLDFEKTEKYACKLLGVRNSSSLWRAMMKILPGKQKTGLKKDRLKARAVCKIASTLGQTYAFLNNPLAEAYFQESLEALHNENQKGQDPDYFITASYLMHWYIEQMEYEKYTEIAKFVFGGYESLEKQLDYILEKGKVDQSRETAERSIYPNYALFAFIKAFYVFYKNDQSNHQVLMKLTHIDETVKGYIDSTMGHPWEIIYKYAALLEEYDKSIKSGSNIEKSRKSVRPVGIVGLVVSYGELEYRESRIEHGHVNQNSQSNFEKKYIEALWDKVKEMPEIPNKWTEKEGDAVYKRKQLGKMFSYMYH